MTGRKRNPKNRFPPRFHVKGKSCYHVVYRRDEDGVKRVKWDRLGSVCDFASCLEEYYQRERGDLPTVRTFYDLAREFRKHGFIKRGGKPIAEKTRDNYERALRNLEEVFGPASLDEITPPAVATYVDTRSARGAANTEHAVLSKMFRLAIRRGWADSNPAEGVGYHHIERRRRYITDDEFVTLYAAIETYQSPKPGQRDIAWIFLTLAYATGLRVQDVLDVRVSDFRDGFLWIEESKAGVRKKYPLEHGGKLTLVGECLARAQQLPGRVRSMFLVPKRGGGQYTYSGVRSLFRRLCDKAGLTDVRIHDIRRRAATDAVERGDRAQDFTAHKTESEANGYVIAAAYKAVTPLGRKFTQE